MEIASALPIAAGIPAGAIVPYAGSAAPAGWLLCHGQLVSRTTYAALFAAISTAYGVGDGSTTFGVPDLRGRVPAGLDSGGAWLTGDTANGVSGAALGNSGGRQSHQQTPTEMATHDHSFSQSNTVSTTASGGARWTGGGAGGTVMTSAGGNGVHNNVQPTLIVNYMIATGGP
jgi:microcystin-dependent protein